MINLSAYADGDSSQFVCVSVSVLPRNLRKYMPLLLHWHLFGSDWC